MKDKIRVLLADDHTLVRMGLKMLLAAADGFDVVGEAENDEEAVRLAEASRTKSANFSRMLRTPHPSRTASCKSSPR